MYIIKVERRWKMENYTISRLYLNGVRYYEALEDKDRGLVQTDSLEKIKKVKVKGETAIPKGKYLVDMNTVSPKYAKIAWAKKLCGGKMPRLVDVPGWEGVLFHPLTDASQTEGCIGVGKNLVKGKILESRACFEHIYKEMKAAHDRGEQIYVEIV